MSYFLKVIRLLLNRLLTASGVATGVARGQSATPDSKKIAKIGKKEEEIRKNREKIRKNREKKKNRGKKGKNREVSFTLPLLTDRAGYATANCLLQTRSRVPLKYMQ